jgi:hypothetical protein
MTRCALDTGPDLGTENSRRRSKCRGMSEEREAGARLEALRTDLNLLGGQRTACTAKAGEWLDDVRGDTGRGGDADQHRQDTRCFHVSPDVKRVPAHCKRKPHACAGISLSVVVCRAPVPGPWFL